MTNKTEQPNVVLVVAHPDHDSVTWDIARAVEQGIRADGITTATTHDLTASGFDPVYAAADVALHRQLGGVPADVLREQQLLDPAEVIVVLFPVYWWSMPALAKGWIDRVFTRGWAYHDDDAHSAVRQLHFVAVAGVQEGTYDRRGYKEAMTTQLVEGIAGYSGIAESSIEFLYGTEALDARGHAELIAEGHRIGATMARRALRAAGPAMTPSQ